MEYLEYCAMTRTFKYEIKSSNRRLAERTINGVSTTSDEGRALPKEVSGASVHRSVAEEHMKLSGLYILAALVLVGNGAGELKATNLIVNGSFESPSVGTNWSNFANGLVPGWNDTSGSDGIEIDFSPVIGGPAYDGTQSMEVNATTFDTVSQTVTGLTVGQEYLLFWAYGDRPSSGPQQLDVYFGGKLVTIDSDTSATDGNSSLVWFPQSFIVTATSTSEVLSFAAVDVGGRPSYGNEIDGVSLESIPEPATLLLVAPGLIGLLGFSRRRALLFESASGPRHS